jgi:hypothetical protein
MDTHLQSRHTLASILAPAALALTACGGGSDPAPSALTISGTAALGTALAGATVDVRCSGGSASATTGTDGGYTVALPQATLPCLLRATAGDTVLHSLATGSADRVRANLTPASELLLARWSGQEPAALFAASTVPAVDGAALAAASDALVATLKAGGVDLSGMDLLAGPLLAAHGSTAGDAHDQALDALKTALAEAGMTLATLRRAIVRASPDAPASALSAAPSLPPDLLLRPAAANCAALRSGRYRYIQFGAGSDVLAQTGVVELDARTLIITDPQVPDGGGDLVAAGECRYLLSEEDDDGEMVVAQSGVAVVRSREDGIWKAFMLIPEQTHPLSALAGDWSYLALDNRGSGVQPFLGERSLDAQGRITGAVVCPDMKTCSAETVPAGAALVANPQGGFDDDDARVFAYRSGGGALMLVWLNHSGGPALATRRAARGLSPIGSVSASWNLALTPALSAPAPIGESRSTTVSHAADGSSWLRDAVINFSTGSTRPETVQINLPRDGFIHRPLQTVTTSDGASSTVGEWFGLTITGSGITPVALVSSQQYLFSVAKPPAP